MSKFVEGDFVKHTRIGVVGHISDYGVCLVTFADGKDMIKEEDLVAIKAAGPKTEINIEKLKKKIWKLVNYDDDSRFGRGYRSALEEILDYIERKEKQNDPSE